jgi:predicted DNA-binding transcriptional regulator
MYTSIVTHSRLARKVGSFDAAAVYLALLQAGGWTRFRDVDWTFHPRSIKTVRSYVAMLEAMGLVERKGILIRAVVCEEWL